VLQFIAQRSSYSPDATMHTAGEVEGAWLTSLFTTVFFALVRVELGVSVSMDGITPESSVSAIVDMDGKIEV
jgi:hypothetical protein